MARLLVESGDDSGMIYSLGSEPVLIGRAPDCAIQLLDRRISRYHARIIATELGFDLEDMESRNGTFLNHHQVTGRVKLNHNDTIAVGGTQLLFELDPSEMPRPDDTAQRVRLAVGLTPSVRAAKPVDSDTTPLGVRVPLRNDVIADPAHRLQVLYQLSGAFRGELDSHNLLNKLMNLIWRVIAPDRGVIFLQDAESGTLKPVTVKTEASTAREIIISQQVVEKAMAEKTAILVADAMAQPGFDPSESMIRSNIRSIICTPLVAHGRSFGVIYVDTQGEYGYGMRSFSSDDLELMTGITNQAALALENARLHEDTLKHQKLERELEIARDIQEQLLPANYPTIAGLDVAALCEPARQVGGDYYDFFEVGDGRTALVLADASGKGVPAAISVAMVRTAIRARVRTQTDVDLGTMVAGLNAAFCHDRLRDNYVTLCIMLYDPAANTITYTNAGNVPPLVFRADGEIQTLTAGGPLLAALEEATYDAEVVTLNPGDVVLMYSDGLTDTHNLRGEMFGEERLTQAMRHARELSARRISDYLMDSIARFRETREPFDDLTLVVLKVKPNDLQENQTQYDDDELM